MKKTAILLIFASITTVLFSQEGREGAEDLFKKGEAYFFQKKYEIAERTLINVIQSRPDHPKAFSYLGDISLFNRRYNDAVKYFNIAKEVSARPGYEYFRLGQTYIELKRYDAALGNFQSAYSLDPSYKPSLYQIGYVYLMFKRDKYKTIEYWKKFIAEAPGDYQYESVKRAIAMLEDSSCIIPPETSGISMEEVLMNCGQLVQPDFAKTRDSGAGLEKEKTNNDTEGLLNDVPDGF